MRSLSACLSLTRLSLSFYLATCLSLSVPSTLVCGSACLSLSPFAVCLFQFRLPVSVSLSPVCLTQSVSLSDFSTCLFQFCLLVSLSLSLSARIFQFHLASSVYHLLSLLHSRCLPPCLSLRVSLFHTQSFFFSQSLCPLGGLSLSLLTCLTSSMPL